MEQLAEREHAQAILDGAMAQLATSPYAESETRAQIMRSAQAVLDGTADVRRQQYDQPSVDELRSIGLAVERVE